MDKLRDWYSGLLCLFFIILQSGNTGTSIIYFSLSLVRLLTIHSKRSKYERDIAQITKIPLEETPHHQIHLTHIFTISFVFFFVPTLIFICIYIYFIIILYSHWQVVHGVLRPVLFLIKRDHVGVEYVSYFFHLFILFIAY